MTELDTPPLAREPEIQRLNRLYSTMSHVSQAIVRMQTRERLFRDVCEALVQRGRLRLAWIGWYDSKTRELVPVAQHGDVAGNLEIRDRR